MKKLNKKNVIITLVGLVGIAGTIAQGINNIRKDTESDLTRMKIEQYVEDTYGDYHGDIDLVYFNIINEYQGYEIYEIGLDWNDGQYFSTDQCCIQVY